MGGKVILLYKRRQLLLRDDQPPETPELNAAPDYENLEQTAANKLQHIAEACKVRCQRIHRNISEYQPANICRLSALSLCYGKYFRRFHHTSETLI